MLNLTVINARTVLLCLCVSMCAVAGNQAVAFDDAKVRKPAGIAVAQKATLVKLTVDQEENALKFARQNHAELANLLEQLRKRSPTAFHRGTREVHLASQRLERFREKSPARFEMELKNWKVTSEIQLLTAKWAISKSPKLEKQIQVLLRQRQQSKIDRLRSERDKLAERLEQLDRQIGMDTAEQEADLAAEWDRLAKRAAVSMKAQRSPNPRKSVTGKSAKMAKGTIPTTPPEKSKQSKTEL